MQPRRRRRRSAPRSTALVALLCALASAAAPASARDRWSWPLPAVRLLDRTTRYPDGRPVVLHAAFVDLCAPGVSLRVTAPEEARRSVPDWARRVDAAVAINGDFFDGQPIRPLGPARGAGRWWPTRDVEYYGSLVVTGAGLPVTVLDRPDWGYVSRAQIVPGASEVLASQEHVVSRGRVQLSPFVVHAGRNPRSGLGLTEDGRTLVLVTVDGRLGRSSGATTPELAALMLGLGVYEGVRLDGGGSSTLYVRGRGVVNTPSDGYPRVVANHLGVLVARDPASSSGPPAWCAIESPR